LVEFVYGTAFRGFGKTDDALDKSPSAAKAALVLWLLTARLEAASLQTGLAKKTVWPERFSAASFKP